MKQNHPGLFAPSLFALVLTGAALSLQPAFADGSLAVGLRPNGDVAYGYAVNHAKAQAAALTECRKRTNQAAKFCKTVATFKKECFAVAWDPDPGPGGFGWAIGADLEKAEQRAIAACQVTARPSRSQYCKIEKSGCDK